MLNARGRVLIVEDAPALAETYAEYLKTENCSVDILGTGKQALAGGSGGLLERCRRR